MQPYIHVPFPAFFYGPSGEAKIFENAESVPKGWVDSPQKVKQDEGAELQPDSGGGPDAVNDGADTVQRSSEPDGGNDPVEAVTVKRRNKRTVKGGVDSDGS